MLHDSGGGHRSDDLLTMRLSTTEKLQFLQSLAYQSTEKDTVQAMITNLNRGIKVDMFDQNVLSSRIVNITQNYENLTRGHDGPFNDGEEKTLLDTFLKNVEVVGGHSNAANNLRTAIKRKQPKQLLAATDEVYLINHHIASSLMNIRNYFDIDSLKRKRNDDNDDSESKSGSKRNKLSHDKTFKDRHTHKPQHSSTDKAKSITVCKTCGRTHLGVCNVIGENNANHTSGAWFNSPAHIWFRDQYQSRTFKNVAAVRRLDKNELERFNKGKLYSKAIDYINSLSYDDHNIDLLSMNIILQGCKRESKPIQALLDTGATSNNYISLNLANELRLKYNFDINNDNKNKRLINSAFSNNSRNTLGQIALELKFIDDFNTCHNINIIALIIDIAFDLIIGRPTIKQFLFVDKVPSHFFSKSGVRKLSSSSGTGEIVPTTVAHDENAIVPLAREKIKHVNSEGDGAFFIKDRTSSDYRFRYGDATGKRRAIQSVDSIASLRDHTNTSRKSPFEMDDVTELEQHHLKAQPHDLVENNAD